MPNAPPNRDDAMLDRLATIENQLAELLSRQAGPAPRFLTIAGAAEYCSLSPDSIRRLVQGHKLTALHPVPGRILLDRSEVEQTILGSLDTPRNGRGKRGAK